MTPLEAINKAIVVSHLPTAEEFLAALAPTALHWRENPRQWIFRGQRCASWKLAPTAFRKGAFTPFLKGKDLPIVPSPGKLLTQDEAEYQKKLARPENKEIMTMHLDSEERGIKKGRRLGRQEGLQSAVQKAWTVRFGELPAQLRLRMEQVNDLKALNALLEAVLTTPDRASAEIQFAQILP